MKRASYCLAVVLILLGLFIYRLDGFSMAKIQGPLLEGISTAPSKPVREMLQQPFHYLAKGHQCFVFVSEDGSCVIKFFNYSRFSLPEWAMRFPLPSPMRERLDLYAFKRKKRLGAQMDSFELAAEFFQQETGLFYLHLRLGGDLTPLTVSDGAGRRHKVDLNQIAFLLQEKAVPIFDELLESKSLEKVEEYLDFLKKRCDLCIADDDRDVEINFGFSNGRLILLDPGRLFFNPSLSTQEGRKYEIMAATKRMRKWLCLHFPESLDLFDCRVEEITSIL